MLFKSAVPEEQLNVYFDRVSVDVNKLQTDLRALREPEAAWGSSLLFRKGHLVTTHPLPISFINSGSLSGLDAETGLVVTLVRLRSGETSPLQAAEMPLCGNASWVQAQGPG